MQDQVNVVHANRGRSAPSLYMMSWVAVAALGLGYIGVAATRPDLLGAILPLAEPAQDQIVAGRQSNELVDELVSLRKWVHELQHELAATKSTLQEQVAHSSSILQRLNAAEERLAVLREVKEQLPAPKAAPPRAQTRAQAPAPAVAPPATAVAAAAPPAAQPAAAAASPDIGNVKVINGGSAPIATGSVPDVAPVAPPFSAPKVTAAAPASPRSIEIGSADSLDNLRARWGQLSGSNADVLGSLAPRYRLAADGRAAPFTLLAGPFDTTADATRTCAALRAKGVACRVGAYSGNAF